MTFIFIFLMKPVIQLLSDFKTDDSRWAVTRGKNQWTIEWIQAHSGVCYYLIGRERTDTSS